MNMDNPSRAVLKCKLFGPSLYSSFISKNQNAHPYVPGEHSRKQAVKYLTAQNNTTRVFYCTLTNAGPADLSDTLHMLVSSPHLAFPTVPCKAFSVNLRNEPPALMPAGAG